MTVTGPRVRDFTADQGRFPVEVAAAPVFELLMSLFTYSSMVTEPENEFAVGTAWFDGVRSQASPELLTTLERLSTVGEVWIELVATTFGLAEPRTIESLVAHLRSGDPIERRLEHIVRGCMHCGEGVDSALLYRVAAGDVAAIDELAELAGCKASDGLRHLLEIDAAESMELLASAIEMFDRDVFQRGTNTAPVLERDAEHKRALAATMKAPQLVELATNGITFEMQSEVDGIVLIPSVVVRPWVTIGHKGRQRIFCYPVADEHLTADPDSPPMRLVEIYKALGDERRLRLMRLLIDGPISLADITERVDLAKSTVHHHLSILRQAGLVLITLDAEKEYSLRQGALPEAASLLAGFLTPTTKE